MKKILVADDETRMRILISDFLSMQGYTVIEASDGEEALKLYRENDDIKLVVLDIMMPKIDGWEVCKNIRKDSNVPIIMLTAKNTEPDEVTGFMYGADEYITKPFSPSIFTARVNALYKRTYGGREQNLLTKGAMTIDKGTQEVQVNGEDVNLSSMEFKLIEYFVMNEELVLTREMLLDNVWGMEYQGTDRTVDTHINRLRTKLSECGGYIQTVRGCGYRFKVI